MAGRKDGGGVPQPRGTRRGCASRAPAALSLPTSAHRKECINRIERKIKILAVITKIVTIITQDNQNSVKQYIKNQLRVLSVSLTSRSVAAHVCAVS